MQRAFATIIILLAFESAAFAISCVRGFVTDPNGSPVVACDLDFDDAITGQRLYTPGDNTDQTGFYTVCVPNGTYNISWGPPPGTHLLGFQLFNQTLSGNIQIDVTLDFGLVISGLATDSATGAPIGRVNLNVDDLATNQRIYTPNDKSDSLTGEYWVVVPPGDYRLRYKAPLGSRWRSLQMEPVSVFADTVINVALPEGVLLGGQVTDNIGTGLPNIAIDLRTMDTGEKLYLPASASDSLGNYSVPVPTGYFQLRYVPLPGDRHVSVAIDSFYINADMMHDQILETGWLVSAFVHDSSGTPLEFANIDVIQISTGQKLYTANDKTDSTGMAIISLLPDLYTFRFQPPPGSIYDRLVVDSVTISADTSFDIALPEVPKVNLIGKVTDTRGIGLPDISIDFADTLFGSRVYVANNTTDSAGFYNLMVPIGTFQVEIAPPRGSHNTGLAFGNASFSQDTSWSDIVLQDGFVVSAVVYDSMSNPYGSVDFDFITETGEIIFTPHDNTDIDGTADITVPPGIYTIALTPPDMNMEPEFISGFSLQGDTSITLTLGGSGGSPASDFKLQRNFPNPFNEQTSISYILFVETEVKLDIYNILGQRMVTFDQGLQAPGYYQINWDGRDGEGRHAASGMYFYRLNTSKGKKTHSMLLVK